MSMPLWAAELAAEFWREAGGPEPFPRTLRGPITRAPFDLTVKEVAGLTFRGVGRYLAGQDVELVCGGRDRPLRGCLVASCGAGFVFLEAADPADERVFSLAHELAHFLRDYLRPRRRAVAALGEGVLEVLDGLRPARAEERLHALLRGVPAGAFVHLMERSAALPPAVAAAERDADRLACELLAPEAEVRRRLPEGAGCFEVAELLTADFGLPRGQAIAHAEDLFPPAPSSPLVERLKKALAARRTSSGGRES